MSNSASSYQNRGGRGGGNWNSNNKRTYYNSNWKQAQYQQNAAIGPGLCGLFFTAIDERRAVREARNLIDHLLTEQEKKVDADEMSQKASNDDKQDIADSLKAECNKLQKEKSDKAFALQQLETGAKCTLFFISPKITQANVYDLATKMAQYCQQEPQNRFLAKVIPIEETVPAYMDQILPALSKMIGKHLAKYTEMTTMPPTYAIDFKGRNSNLIKKQNVYDEVTALVTEQSPGSSVNLTQPDLLIVVHTIRTIAFLAILRDYEKLQKYVLRKPEEKEEKEGAKKAKNDEDQKNDEEEEGDGVVEEEE